MRTTIDRFTLDLAPATAVPLDAARGYLVRVDMGVVWITEEHETGDHVLRIGQSYRVRQGGRVVVEAFTAARIAVEAPQPATLVMAQRAVDWIAAAARRLRGRKRRAAGAGLFA